MDIIEHEVISIRQFEDFNHYVLRAVKNVGACGKVQVIISESRGEYRFHQLHLMDEDTAYSSGLWDFVEGMYYTDLNEAKIKFYEMQEMTSRIQLDRQKIIYEEIKKRHDKIKMLIEETKQLLKERMLKN